MIKNVLMIIAIGQGLNAMAQNDDCPSPEIVPFNKVMNLELAEDYEDCPVIIEGKFLKTGFVNGMRKPQKLRKMVYFQASNMNGDMKTGITGEHGHFFVIDKENSDVIFSLSKGDKIRFTGRPFVQRYLFNKLGPYFIVDKLSVIE